MEWYGAFGLMIRLVWLYIEFLRLRSKLQSRRRRGLRTRKRRFGAFFFSGDARWATVGAHLGAMGIAGKAIAPECAPTKRWVCARMFGKLAAEAAPAKAQRSEERRVGKEGVSQCKTRGSPVHYKK